jgi:hypothetical protein
MVSGTITVNKPLLLVGAGRDITIVKSTVDHLPVFSIISWRSQKLASSTSTRRR